LPCYEDARRFSDLRGIVTKRTVEQQKRAGKLLAVSLTSVIPRKLLKTAFEQNGQGLILRPRVFYKVGVPRKVLTGVNASLLRTNVTKKI
jgi:hypothetical protein